MSLTEKLDHLLRLRQSKKASSIDFFSMPEKVLKTHLQKWSPLRTMEKNKEQYMLKKEKNPLTDCPRHKKESLRKGEAQGIQTYSVVRMDDERTPEDNS